MVFVCKVNIWLRHFNTSTPISWEFIWFLGKFRSSSLRPVITLNDREILRESSAREFEVLIATALENCNNGEVFFWWSSSSANINPSTQRWPYQLYTMSFMSKLWDWIKAETIMLDLSQEENWSGNWKSFDAFALTVCTIPGRESIKIFHQTMNTNIILGTL